MHTRKWALKWLLVVSLFLSVAGVGSYCFSDSVLKMYNHPFAIVLNISLLVFTLSCMYLQKIKSYLIYNYLVHVFFSVFCIGKIYLVVVKYPSVSLFSSLSGLFVGLAFSGLFWLLMHIPNKVLLRHDRICLMKENNKRG